MTPRQFEQMLARSASEINSFIQNTLPDIVGTEAVNHFKENFDKEGFVDKSKQPWKEVKRRMDPRVRGARATRKILSGDTGELKEAIEYEKNPGEVIITNDKPYASAHNEGTTNAGRGHHTVIPQRKFIGHSADLDEKIEKEMISGIDKILGGP